MKKKYAITGPFFLYVGTLQPRKNINKLIQAFALLNRPRLKLVIGGKRGWFYEQIYEEAKRLKVEDRVIFTGFIPDEDLPALIKASRAYVLPSLYEGFGMPPVEAQAVGTPVVVSQVSSLPEVVGQSGIYIKDPHSAKSIATSLTQVLNMSPSQRQDTIRRGKENVKRFDWDESAKKLLQIISSTT